MAPLPRKSFEINWQNASDSLSFVWTALAIFCGAAIGLAALWLNFSTAISSGTGISDLARKPPTWDFTNIWFAGRLALEGRLDVLFDVEAYRAELHAMFSPAIDDSEWSYPPLALFLGAPLALLPLYPAYIVWTVLTLVFLIWSARRLGLTWAGCALLALSPGVLMNIVFGQCAALATGLLMAGLWFAAAAPKASGAFFAILLFKPQFGLLAPVALAAAGRWKAFLAASGLGLLLIGASVVAFGGVVWSGFFQVTRPLMHGILTAPFGAGYHANSVTVFAAMRAMGLGVAEAYAVQAAATAAVVAATVWIWRRAPGDRSLKCVTTGALTLLATPYAFGYDMLLLSLAACFLWVRHGYRFGPILGIGWVWPAVNHLWNQTLQPIAPLIVIGVVAVCLAELLRAGERRETNAGPASLSA